jgi:hypothetical protein
MNLLLLVCFLIFKQFRGSGWLQRECSLIQVSNLISNCMRWLIQNLDLILQCRPSLLQLGRHVSSFWVFSVILRPITSNSLHCGGLFQRRGSTRVSYSRSQVQTRKYSLLYNPTLNNKNHKIQQDP